jgi:hypothetical protein
MSRTILLLGLFLAAACSSTPVMPPGEGRGLVAFDPAPPAGAQTWSRPTWQVGDRFTLLRGGVWKGVFEVVAADDKGYLIADDRGNGLRRDLDLGTLGDYSSTGEPLHLQSPVDVRFHWPLWIGKHWRCEFADRIEERSLKVSATYAVEGLDTVTVPAGVFQALRIVRTLHINDSEQYLDHSQVIWYAPEIGLEVRQLINDTMVELIERARK